MPNSTRAAGILIHWESLLRERWNLAMYWHSNVKATRLSDEDFFLISQMSSLLYPVGALVKIVQTDRPGAISYTLFFAIRTWVVYLTQKKWHVAETRRSEHPEDISRWDASYNFPPRKYNGTPTTDGATGKKKNKPNKYIPMTHIMRENLHPTAKKLLERLASEMTAYGAKPTKDRLLAMACNPFTATHGMEELDLWFAYLENNDTYTDLVGLVKLTDYQKTCMDTLEHQIKLDCELIIPNDNDRNRERSTAVTDNDDTDTEEMDEMEELRRKRAKEREHNEPSDQDLDAVQRQVRSYFNQQFDPRSGMPAETHSKIGATKKLWMKQWEIIVEHFDIFQWWETIGKVSFPLIYPVAIRILSLPDSNGNQERTFSAATWMDGKLNSRQNDTTFQMKVLLYKNQGFLEEHKKEVLEENKKAAETRTKAFLKSSTKEMQDSDID